VTWRQSPLEVVRQLNIEGRMWQSPFATEDFVGEDFVAEDFVAEDFDVPASSED